MMMPSADRIGATAAALIATVTLVWAAPSNEQAALNLYRVFAPVALLCGIGLMLRGLLRWRREGWDRPVEGYIVSGVFIAAAGHDWFRASIRRAADAAGFASARLMEHSDYRILSAAVLCVTGLWLLRWVTLPELGEWGWVAAFLAWGSIVLFADHQIAAGLVWLYVTLFLPVG